MMRGREVSINGFPVEVEVNARDDLKVMLIKGAYLDVEALKESLLDHGYLLIIGSDVLDYAEDDDDDELVLSVTAAIAEQLELRHELT